VYLVTGNEIHSPRGKQHLRAKIEKGERSSHFAEIFSQCLLCGACREACPRGLDTPELVIRVRSELPRISGISFLKYISRKALVNPSILAGLSRLGSAAGKLLEDRLPQDSGLRLRLHGFNRNTFRLPGRGYIEKLKSEPASDRAEQAKDQGQGINYFTGCLANHLQPGIAEALQFLVAETTGRKAAVPLTQTCCGMAGMSAGRPAEAIELARSNIKAFEGNDLPILTSCSSCYFQLKTYKELLADDPEWRKRAADFTERLREFSPFFLKKFSAEKDRLLASGTFTPSDLKVYYHDPCHLRFKLKIMEEPRNLLRIFPGLDLRELPGGPKCCGHGGLFQVAHPDLAQRIWHRDMTDYGDAALVTACSGCLLQWQSGLADINSNTRAKHLAVFIAELLKQKL
jgi:glycolate oxidase iron-sulfur subunit